MSDRPALKRKVKNLEKKILDLELDLGRWRACVVHHEIQYDSLAAKFLAIKQKLESLKSRSKNIRSTISFIKSLGLFVEPHTMRKTLQGK